MLWNPTLENPLNKNKLTDFSVAWFIFIKYKSQKITEGVNFCVEFIYKAPFLLP